MADRPAFSRPDAALLPLGALLFAASAGALAQTPSPDGAATANRALSTVEVREKAETPQTKNDLRVRRTTIGKGNQDVRDIPQSVTIQTERLMDDRNLDDLREVLRNTAGVTFQAGETGEEDVRLRGFSLGQAGDIYVDGFRDAPLYERDTFNLDRVEVLKGSASMLFGKGSTGGVVNQVSKQPFLMTQHEVDYTLGSGKSHRVTGDFNFVTGQDAAVRLNVMRHKADNWGAETDRYGIAPSFRWGIGTANEFLVALYHTDFHSNPIYAHRWIVNNGRIQPTVPARNFYGFSSDYNDSLATHLTLGHKHRFANGGQLETRLRHGRFERDLWATVPNWTNPPTAGTAVTRTTNKGRVGVSHLTQLQSDYTNSFDLGGRRHELIAGVDLYKDDAERNQNFTGPTNIRPGTTIGTPNDGVGIPDTRGTPAMNTFDASTIGLYAQDTVTLAPAWKLVGGLRFDRFKGSYRNATGALTSERTDNLWSPRVGLLYQPSDTASYYVSYGTSYNTSGDAYQYAININANTARTANTPPEKSRNFEVGAKWDLFQNRALLGLAFFYSEKYNERNTDPDVAAAQELLSGKRHAAGIEFNLAGRITPAWEVYVNHTWIPDAKIDKSNVVLAANGGGAQVQGDRPGLTPRHSGSLWTTYRVLPKLRLGAGLNWRSSQHPEGARNIVADSFVTADLMAEYTINDIWSAKFNLTNVTDKLYADALYRGFYAPGAPRRAELTLKAMF